MSTAKTDTHVITLKILLLNRPMIRKLLMYLMYSQISKSDLWQSSKLISTLLFLRRKTRHVGFIKYRTYSLQYEVHFRCLYQQYISVYTLHEF